MKTRKIARISVLIALALLLHFVEQLLPPLLYFAPGAKIGLGNIIILLAIILYGNKEAFAIMIIKAAFAGIFGGNIFGLVYSFGGGICAFTVMSLLYRFFKKHLSVISISIAGAITHNSIQTLIAAILVRQVNYVLLLPFMLVASVLAGIVVGLTVYFIIKYVPAKVLLSDRS